MDHVPLAHLELLAEVDALVAELRAWGDSAPRWPPAQACQSLVRRLLERADQLRVRLDAPLIVATLGGTGTGKSSLVNALLGREVVIAGKERPTTRLPTLLCRHDLSAEILGLDPHSVRQVKLDLPALRDLVLIDCPDPDTTEGESSDGTNLARLRSLLPFCDVLLVTSTQQKYRSARVAEELASAAPGARLVFVQTHADCDDDIRPDWRQQLAEHYAVGEMFLVDSVQALADAQAGLEPRGEFGRLVDLLTRELAGAAGTRIRRINFLDLVDETLAACVARLQAAWPPVAKLDLAIEEQRAQLARQLAQATQAELTACRRQWESRLLGEVATRWGVSPFALVLRAWQAVGTLISGAALTRIRTPAQLALWGAWETGRSWKRRREQQQADAAPERALAWSWEPGELRLAGTILDGYAAEAGLPRQHLDAEHLARQAQQAGQDFVVQAGADLQSLIARQAARHSGWFVRGVYELLLLSLVGVVGYRLAKNFFYDSWLAPELGWTAAPAPLLGLDFFIPAGFFLLLWCLILLGLFTRRVRRGLTAELNTVGQQWSSRPQSAAALFAPQQAAVRQTRQFIDAGLRLRQQVEQLRQRVSQVEPRLGRKIA